jgi:molecular chaperone HtpG
VKRVLSLLEDLAEKEPEKYAKFWKEFGRVFKEGTGEDPTNLERIARLLRFPSTHKDTEIADVSLADYLLRMKPGQEKIYYVTAETFAAAKNSPHLEIFRKKGVEVLLLHERVDEWVVGHLPEFDGKALQSVAKGRLELGTLEDEAEKQAQEQDAGEFKDLAARVKQALGERVKDVRITHRLTESPACLVSDQHDLGANLHRIMKSVGQKAPDWKPILEINPRHPLVLRMKADLGGARLDDMSHLLFDQSLLAEGGQVEDPAAFVRRLNGLMLELAGRAP